MIAHGLMLLTAVWLIKKCDSMTSMSCLVIAGAVMIMTTFPWVSKRVGNIHILVGSAVSLSLFAAFVDTSGELLHLLGRDSTLTGRTEIWKAVLSLNTNPLVGTGYESFWLGDRIEKVWRLIGFTGIAEAHNGYLDTYINLGAIGLFLLGMLLLNAYRHVLVTLRRHPHAGRLSLALFTAGLIYNLTESGFKMMTPLWLAFLLGITCVPAIQQLQERRQTSARPLAQSGASRKMRVLR
jgi:O-antigen ligase